MHPHGCYNGLDLLTLNVRNMLFCVEEETWTTIDTTNTRAASGAARANPEAGPALTVLLPARVGAVPPQGDPIPTARKAAGLLLRGIHMKITSAAARRQGAARLTPDNPAMNAARHPAGAARPLVNMAQASAAVLRLAGRVRPALAGLRLLPVPAAAGDTAPPAVTPAALPVHRERKKRNGVIAFAFNQGRFLYFQSRL